MRFRDIKVGEEYLVKCFNNEKFECTAKRVKTATLPNCIMLRNIDGATAVCHPIDVIRIPKEDAPKVNPAEAIVGCYAVKETDGCLGCCFIKSLRGCAECRAPLRKDKCGVIFKLLPEVGKCYRVIDQTDYLPFCDVVEVKGIVGHELALCVNGRGTEVWAELSSLSEKPVEPIRPNIPYREEQFLEKDNVCGLEYGVGKDTEFITISAPTLLRAQLTAIANGITEESITQCRMIQPDEWRPGETS